MASLVDSARMSNQYDNNNYYQKRDTTTDSHMYQNNGDDRIGAYADETVDSEVMDT